MPRSRTSKTRNEASGSLDPNGDGFFPNAPRQRAAGPTREKQPFTVPHFRAWAKNLILDNDQPWEIEPFQARFLKDVFSGKFLEAIFRVPEGNAKTTLTGGVVLYFCEHRKYARIPVAASSRDQAEWLYQAAAGFVERSELKQFKCQEGYRRIKCEASGGRIQIFAADDRTGDGIVPGGLCVLEELHRHRNLNLYRTWQGKLQKRGAMLIGISTAGEPDGEFEALCKTMRDEGVVTRKGSFLRAVGPHSVLQEYAVPEDGDPDNLAEVLKANPLKAITPEVLERKYTSPSMTPAHWRRFVCNQPNRLESWVEPKVWDGLEWDVGNVADGDDVYVCVRVATGVGIGIASPRDEKAAVKMLMIPKPASGRVGMWQVEAALRDIAQRYRVLDISYDADQFLRSAEILEEEGLPMTEVPQRARRLAQATATIWRYISGGLLGHDGDPELRSQVLGARTKETIQGWHLDPMPGTAGLIAVAMALFQATELATPTPKIHVYRGA